MLIRDCIVEEKANPHVRGRNRIANRSFDERHKDIKGSKVDPSWSAISWSSSSSQEAE